MQRQKQLTCSCDFIGFLRHIGFDSTFQLIQQHLHVTSDSRNHEFQSRLAQKNCPLGACSWMHISRSIQSLQAKLQAARCRLASSISLLGIRWLETVFSSHRLLPVIFLEVQKVPELLIKAKSSAMFSSVLPAKVGNINNYIGCLNRAATEPTEH